GIVAFAEHRPPTGRLEALNNNWEALVRRGRGYRDHNYLFRKLQFMTANPIRNQQRRQPLPRPRSPVTRRGGRVNRPASGALLGSWDGHAISGCEERARRREETLRRCPDFVEEPELFICNLRGPLGARIWSLSLCAEIPD